MTENQNLNAILAAKTTQEAITLLNGITGPDASPTDTVLLLKTLRDNASGNPSLMIEIGKRLWKLGLHGDAMSAYEAAAQDDPDGPARLLIEHSNSIMDFFNTDLLNP